MSYTIIFNVLIIIIIKKNQSLELKLLFYEHTS